MSRSDGFTLVEMLIVVVILGVLATVTVFAVRGITDRGEDASCAADARTVTQAADYYMGNFQVDSVPPTGLPADVNRYEQTLVNAGFMTQVSILHTLAPDGTVSAQAPTCV